MNIENAKTQAVPNKRARPLKLRVHALLRWLHIYISMFSLLLILFFALTGVTLNHPEWSFNSATMHRDIKGTLPANWRTGETVNWLRVAEYLRQTHGVRGHAADPRLENGEGSIGFKAPGYSADCFIEQKTGAYELSVDASGPVAWLNDLHRGQDAGTLWARVIDASGIFLTLIALTGLGLLFYLKKVRAPALIVLAVGVAIALALMKLAG